MDAVENVVSKSTIRRLSLQMEKEEFANFLAENVEKEILKLALSISAGVEYIIIPVSYSSTGGASNAKFD